MDADYWKARCEAAESALQRARSGLQLHQVRREVIDALGELQPEQTTTVGRLAGRLGWTTSRTHLVLASMERVGLVDRASLGRARRGCPGQWKLGHLVQGIE